MEQGEVSEKDDQGGAPRGHERVTMSTFKAILVREAERVWREGKDKNRRKVEHLGGKWRNDRRGGEVDVEKSKLVTES